MEWRSTIQRPMGAAESLIGAGMRRMSACFECMDSGLPNPYAAIAGHRNKGRNGAGCRL